MRLIPGQAVWINLWKLWIAVERSVVAKAALIGADGIVAGAGGRGASLVR